MPLATCRRGPVPYGYDRAMTNAAIDRSWRRRLANAPLRLLSIADDAGDDDDLRRRKRVGVAAGLLTIVAPLTLPLQVPGEPISWIIGFSLSAFSREPGGAREDRRL